LAEEGRGEITLSRHLFYTRFVFPPQHQKFAKFDIRFRKDCLRTALIFTVFLPAGQKTKRKIRMSRHFLISICLWPCKSDEHDLNL